MTQRRIASRALVGLLAAGALLMGTAPAQATTTHSPSGHRVHAPSFDTGWNGT